MPREVACPEPGWRRRVLDRALRLPTPRSRWAQVANNLALGATGVRELLAYRGSTRLLWVLFWQSKQMIRTTKHSGTWFVGKLVVLELSYLNYLESGRRKVNSVLNLELKNYFLSRINLYARRPVPHSPPPIIVFKTSF